MSENEWIVTLPPPTPNGGLHVGHLTGPFLAADAFVKQLRLRNEACTVTTFSDVNQSYVRVTAERQRRDPMQLAHQWSEDIRETLSLFHMEADDFLEPNLHSCNFVRTFFLDLYERGRLVRKKFPAFFASDRGIFLDEAGVSGHCPRCLDQCKCGVCESCGFTNSATTLIAPRDTITGSRNLEIRNVPLMVLETARLRKDLQQFYATNPRFRPRYKWLAEDALRGPLPDFPITLIGTWGIPVNHEDFPDQVINAWPELVVHQLYGHKQHYPDDAQPPRVVNFFGFDNSYFYAILHAALLIASGQRAWLPYSTVTNEFYNLEHSKFSTSKDHVVWARDLAKRHSTDLIRFYAALNAPGWEKANFKEEEMTAVAAARLSQPWRAVTSAYGRLLAEGGDRGEVRREIWSATAAIVSRILASLSLERFNLRQAAEDLTHFLEFIRSEYCSEKSSAIELAFLLKAFSQASFPIMPTGGGRLFYALTGRDLGGLDLCAESVARPIPDDLFVADGARTHHTAPADISPQAVSA
jgi:methionyl-tRNA synthetase